MVADIPNDRKLNKISLNQIRINREIEFGKLNELRLESDTVTQISVTIKV